MLPRTGFAHGLQKLAMPVALPQLLTCTRVAGALRVKIARHSLYLYV